MKFSFLLYETLKEVGKGGKKNYRWEGRKNVGHSITMRPRQTHYVEAYQSVSNY